MKSKKIISTILLLGIMLMSSFPIYATTDTTNEYIKNNQGSAQDVLNNEKNLKYIEEVQWNNLVMPRANYVPTKLNVTAYRQETTYWCGPANIKQVVQYINGSSSSQSTYASSMGTISSDGTYVYKMTNELNKRQSKFTYAYKEISNSMTTTQFMEIVKNSIFSSKPMILHANTKSLYLYNGTALGHYLTLNGFAYDVQAPGPQSPPKIYYTDPYYKDYGRGSVFGTHEEGVSAVLSCVKNRFIIY